MGMQGSAWKNAGKTLLDTQMILHLNDFCTNLSFESLIHFTAAETALSRNTQLEFYRKPKYKKKALELPKWKNDVKEAFGHVGTKIENTNVRSCLQL